MLYVDNYFLSQASNNENSKFKVQPTYKVDYEIPEEIINELKKSYENDDINKIWCHLISGCRNINDLPDYLQKLVIMYLPRFFKQYPQYKDHLSLQINLATAE